MSRPTTAKLKHPIDGGRGGDGVAVIDPAAAPLGTDDEAAGTPPTSEQIAMALRHEIRTGPSSATKDDWGAHIYVAAVLGIFAFIVLGLLYLPI